MWSVFFFACIFAIVLIYVPGFFFIFPIRKNVVDSFIISPVLTIVLYEAAAIICSITELCFKGIAYFGCFSLIGASFFTAWLVAHWLQKRRFHFKEAKPFDGIDFAILTISVLFAAFLAFFIFIRTLDGPESFNQGPDNAWHLGLIRTFADTESYSPLHASLYSGAGFSAPGGTDASVGSFYPSAWHLISAFVVQAMNVSAPLAANAVLTVLLVISFPCSIFYFIRQLFGDDFQLRLAGAIAGVSFSAFPWMLLFFGPLYPNFASLVFVPLVATFFLEILDPCRNTKASSFALFLTGMVALVLLQSSSVFTVAVLLFPAVVSSLYSSVYSISAPLALVKRKLFACGVSIVFCALVAYFWYKIYTLPAMESIVSYEWLPYASARQELINILLLAYRSPQVQIALGIIVLIGAWYIIRSQVNTWTVISYLIACFMVYIAATQESDLDHILNGFWYTDPYRLAANAAILGIPLACAGIKVIVNLWNGIVDYATREFVFPSKKGRVRRFELGFRAVFIISLFCLVNFYPNFTIPGVTDVNTAFGEIESELKNTNEGVESVLDESESEFLQSVSQIVDHDALIINLPDDGSLFGY